MKPPQDWTVNRQTGRSNSSQAFLDICTVVEHLIRSDAAALINGHAESTARLIVAHLAHVHGMYPSKVAKRKR